MSRLVISVAFVVAACAGAPVVTEAPTPAATPARSAHLGSTEGCRPSFWSEPENFLLWEEHRPDDLVGVFFPFPEDHAQLVLADALLPAHEDGGAGTLIRQAIAAILNAAHESLEYPFRRYEVGIDDRPAIVPTVAELLQRSVAKDMTDFAAELSAANSLGCPLG